MNWPQASSNSSGSYLGIGQDTPRLLSRRYRHLAVSAADKTVKGDGSGKPHWPKWVRTTGAFGYEVACMANIAYGPLHPRFLGTKCVSRRASAQSQPATRRLRTLRTASTFLCQLDRCHFRTTVSSQWCDAIAGFGIAVSSSYEPARGCLQVRITPSGDPNYQSNVACLVTPDLLAPAITAGDAAPCTDVDMMVPD